jgi:hypothetical protein
MGEDYKVDTRTTEKLSSRVPLPAPAASELAFELGATEANDVPALQTSSVPDPA